MMKCIQLVIFLLAVMLPCSAVADEMLTSSETDFEIGPTGLRVLSTLEYNSSTSSMFREFIDSDRNGLINQTELDDFMSFTDPGEEAVNSTLNISVDGITEHDVEYTFSFGNIIGPVNSTINLTWESEIIFRFDTQPANEHTIVFLATNSTDPDGENITGVDDSVRIVAADGWRFKSVNHPEYVRLSKGSTEMTLDPMLNETVTDNFVIVIERTGSDDDGDPIPGYGPMVLTSSVLLATIMVTMKRSHPR